MRPQLAASIRNVIVAGDVATVVNNWRLSWSAPDGTPVRMSGTSADVMGHRPDGTWGILIDDPWGLWRFPGAHDPQHPAPFPKELSRRLLQLYSQRQHVVGDPFISASGRTARRL